MIWELLMMTRAAQTHQAGHMRPAGRVFETPALNSVKVIYIFVLAKSNQN